MQFYRIIAQRTSMLLRKKVYDLDIGKYLQTTNDKEIQITINELMSLDDNPLFKILLDNKDLKLRIKSVGYSGSVNEDIKHYPLDSIKDMVTRFEEKYPDYTFKVTIKPLLESNLKDFIQMYEKEKEAHISFYDQLMEMGEMHNKKHKM